MTETAIRSGLAGIGTVGTGLVQILQLLSTDDE